MVGESGPWSIAMSESRVLLVIDGHDGSGKTTLSSRLARSLGGIHVQPYSRPVGQQFARLIERREFELASELARRAVDQVLANSDAPVVICDRHWMTAFSVLPETYWSAWQSLPPTALCWANLETTIARLDLRGKPDEELWDHKHFLTSYWELGQRFGAYLVHTDNRTLDDSFTDLRTWAKRFVN